jgi:hypothetical protein
MGMDPSLFVFPLMDSEEASKDFRKGQQLAFSEVPSVARDPYKHDYLQVYERKHRELPAIPTEIATAHRLSTETDAPRCSARTSGKKNDLETNWRG